MHVYRAAVDRYAFARQKSALETGMRLGNQQFSARADNTVPGDALFRRARRHRVTDRASASGQTKRLRDFSVGGDTPARNLFH